MNTRENNIFLAELLGWSRDEDVDQDGGNWWLTTDCARYIVATDRKRDYHYSDRYWKPDVSWEQLMMVVDKIETMNNGLNGLYGTGRNLLAVNFKRLSSNDFMCSILFNEHDKFKSVNKDKKVAVYDTVLEFAKWYKEISNI